MCLIKLLLDRSNELPGFLWFDKFHSIFIYWFLKHVINREKEKRKNKSITNESICVSECCLLYATTLWLVNVLNYVIFAESLDIRLVAQIYWQWSVFQAALAWQVKSNLLQFDGWRCRVVPLLEWKKYYLLWESIVCVWTYEWNRLYCVSRRPIQTIEKHRNFACMAIGKVNQIAVVLITAKSTVAALISAETVTKA